MGQFKHFLVLVLIYDLVRLPSPPTVGNILYPFGYEPQCLAVRRDFLLDLFIHEAFYMKLPEHERPSLAVVAEEAKVFVRRKRTMNRSVSA